MPDAYFLESFIGGLKPTVKSFVRDLSPHNLYAAMDLARHQEETIQAMKTPLDKGIRFNNSYNSNSCYPLL